MVAHFSIASILWLDLGLHLVAWLLVRHMTGQVAEGARQGSYREALLEGIGHVVRDGRLKWILGCAILANWMITPMNTLLAPYAKDVLSGNAQTFSALELATVIGGIAMSLLYGKWIASVRQDKLFRFAVVLQGLAIAIVAYVSFVPVALVGSSYSDGADVIRDSICDFVAALDACAFAWPGPDGDGRSINGVFRALLRIVVVLDVVL